ncbi:hypothetical protein LTR02_010860 [Friedmanniomyces endolithicus]|uniref:Uncharacterized protein n=1 Tax=Rachicladosporium monterosium TaxID=1507873 RepID=A0ABR0KXI1_9PEZI|nr:hypothetical protein LTR94_014506 [Friedmanniomyces endolithicus]KAK5140197.1 hypothetical protein LTR32_006937 [Rachicladosporium monterosium]KAK0773212.1 hypothetical protein LTR59_015357 [Friedmanniomyces endolithicus]KAK0779651.1 hypothetical protein LTR38_014343 [Friedmanniomyces endolithicus]KAK0780233.1 hypothetical protein LTR75_015100 [Friedmanniomyces endolithicus]
MLEFVHVSGPEAGKDLQTRRKVRSQAMRDFRRRQREEKGKNNGIEVAGYVYNQQRFSGVELASCIHDKQYTVDPEHRTSNARRFVVRAKHSFDISTNLRPRIRQQPDALLHPPAVDPRAHPRMADTRAHVPHARLDATADVHDVPESIALGFRYRGLLPAPGPYATDTTGVQLLSLLCGGYVEPGVVRCVYAGDV